MLGLFFDSVLTCPVCGQKQVCSIPHDERLESLYFEEYECVISVPDDQCRLFYAFGSRKGNLSGAGKIRAKTND